MSTPGGYHNHAIVGSHTHSFSHSHGLPMAHTVSVEAEDMNPDIEVDVKDGYYIAYKKEDGLKRRVFIPMRNLHEEIHFWVLRLNVEQLVACMKIYYDRWTFVSGDNVDRMLFDACERELKNRRDASPFLHQHMLPAHSHSISYNHCNPHNHWANDPFNDPSYHQPVAYMDIRAE